MNIYPNTRYCSLKFRFEFIDQEARLDASASATSENAISNLNQILDFNLLQGNKYVSLDHNRWGLNQGFKALADDTETLDIGYVSGCQSRADASILYPPTLSFSFSEVHGSIGFTIYFEESTGVHSTNFDVKIYNGTSLIDTKTIENHSTICVIDMLCPSYTKVEFIFYELSRPKARLRISEVVFGVIEEFNPNTISSVDLSYAIDPLAETLPINSALVRIDNSDQRFNLINPNGVYAYLQQPQSFYISMGIGESYDTIEYTDMGKFYFVTASAEDSGLTAEICAYDWVYWLEKSQISLTETGTWTLEEAVAFIINTAKISCDIEIAEDLKDISIRKFTDTMSCREALRLSVQACCATTYFDRSSNLIIQKIASNDVADVLNADNMMSSPKVSIESAVNTVNLSYLNDTGETVTYTVSNIISDEMPQVKSFTNNMVIQGEEVATWLLLGLQGRLKYQTRERGNPNTRLADTVEIYDYFGTNHNAIITKQSFKYSGGIEVESEAIKYGTT